MFAKFVPGLATLAPPVAGQNGMPYLMFLFFDAIGATLWLSVLLGVGKAVWRCAEAGSEPVELGGEIFRSAAGSGDSWILYWRACTGGGWCCASWSRLDWSHEELKRQLDAGEQVYIVDLRHPLELVPDPFTLPGALHVSPEELASRIAEIPRDRDMVLYCTCPSEATAAKTAMTLHKLGIDRVRPLRGGFDEWKRLGYPMDAIAPFLQEEEQPLVHLGSKPATVAG